MQVVAQVAQVAHQQVQHLVGQVAAELVPQLLETLQQIKAMAAIHPEQQIQVVVVVAMRQVEMLAEKRAARV